MVCLNSARHSLCSRNVGLGYWRSFQRIILSTNQSSDCVVRYLKKSPHQGSRKIKLDIKAYSDGSFSNNFDLTSQLGYKKIYVTEVVAYSLWRTGHSRAVEWYASFWPHKCSPFLNHSISRFPFNNLYELFGHLLPLKLMTDSKSLFDEFTIYSPANEKILAIDLQTVTESDHCN